MARVLQTRQAREDALDIWEYVAQRNTGAATRLLRAFDRAVRQLSESPEIGARQDQHRAGLRSFPVGKYVIFYEPIPEGVRVIRILHGARHWPELL